MSESTETRTEPAADASRLARRLGLGDAVIVGLGAMIGAGVFVAIAPAAEAAGNALLLGLVVAALVAYGNATSSAELAALHPESGGAYVYGRKRLSPFWGFLAGFGFVVGKLASCAAMALTFAQYAAPGWSHPLAAGAVLALTLVNCLGVEKGVWLLRVLVVGTLVALAVVVVATLSGGEVAPARLWPLRGGSVHGMLQSAGFLFFAFAGYARIATLGEEVLDPRRTIPRAVPLALAIVLVVYLVVAVSVLLVLDADVVARSPAPLAAAVEAGRLAFLSPVVRVGATVACLGVLLSLLVGVSRTVFAMASNGDLPRVFAAVHPTARVPRRAVLGVGLAVAVAALLLDVRAVIGFSSFAVLLYYAVANAAALTLRPDERRWPRALAVVGVLGCLVLAASLPWTSIAAGAGVLAVGALVYVLRTRRSASAPP